MARSLGRGPASSTAVTSSVVNVPSGPHSTQRPPGYPGPGQEVGVVLHHRRRHDIVRLELQPVGEMVDRLGGVAAEHHHAALVALERPAKRYALSRAPS